MPFINGAATAIVKLTAAVTTPGSFAAAATPNGMLIIADKGNTTDLWVLQAGSGSPPYIPIQAGAALNLTAAQVQSTDGLYVQASDGSTSTVFAAVY